MNLRSSMTWWSGFKWRMPRPLVARDLADMGTAFGLDASLDLEPAEPESRRAKAQKNGRPVTGAPQQRAQGGVPPLQR
jgi:hypothetical protein